MCIALLFVAALAGLIFGGVYAFYFEVGILAFAIAYWAGGTICFLTIFLAVLIRGGHKTDVTGKSSSLEEHLALNGHGLDADEHVRPQDSFGAHVIACEAPDLEWTGANEVVRRLG
jgi:hypothetical protein